MNKSLIFVDRYEMRGVLGTGGMATVYLAYDMLLDRLCAVKIMSRGLNQNSIHQERFLNEARVMAKLKHPNIVRLFDISKSDDRHFMVMEVLEGGSLYDWVDQEGSISIASSIPIFTGILQALSEAHSHGIIHRDIKPHNIMMSAEGVPKMGDFGIARLNYTDRSLTRTGMMMGTLSYMPPEQRAGAGDVTETADIFALGCTLYACLTGNDPVDLYLPKHQQKIRDQFDGPLAELMICSTQYDRSDRYQSAEEMAEALALVPVDGVAQSVALEQFADRVKPLSDESSVVHAFSSKNTMNFDDHTAEIADGTTSFDKEPNSDEAPLHLEAPPNGDSGQQAVPLLRRLWLPFVGLAGVLALSLLALSLQPPQPSSQLAAPFITQPQSDEERPPFDPPQPALVSGLVEKGEPVKTVRAPVKPPSVDQQDKKTPLVKPVDLLAPDTKRVETGEVAVEVAPVVNEVSALSFDKSGGVFHLKVGVTGAKLPTYFLRQSAGAAPVYLVKLWGATAAPDLKADAVRLVSGQELGWSLGPDALTLRVRAGLVKMKHVEQLNDGFEFVLERE